MEIKRAIMDGERNFWDMDWDTEERDRDGEIRREEERARLELGRWFFLMGLLLAVLLQVFFDVFLLWGLLIFEGIAGLAVLGLKFLDSKK